MLSAQVWLLPFAADYTSEFGATPMARCVRTFVCCKLRCHAAPAGSIVRPCRSLPVRGCVNTRTRAVLMHVAVEFELSAAMHAVKVAPPSMCAKTSR